MVVITVAIPTPPDHNSIVTIPIFALTDNFAIAVAVTMTATDGDADAIRTDTDADFLSTRRHRNGNSGHCDGGHHKTLDHRMLLSLISAEPIHRYLKRSGGTALPKHLSITRAS